jgi:hypothetical protein
MEPKVLSAMQLKTLCEKGTFAMKSKGIDLSIKKDKENEEKKEEIAKAPMVKVEA